MTGRPRLSLPRKASQAKAAPEALDDQAQARHARQADDDQAHDQAADDQAHDQAADDQAHDQAHANDHTPADDTIRVPAAAWQRAMDLLGAFERGELVPANQLHEALDRVEQLGQQMLQMMGQGPQPQREAPRNHMAAYADALRDRRIGARR